MPPTIRVVAVLSFLGSFLVPASSQISDKGALQGQVVQSVTGAPLRDVVISLSGPYETPVLLRNQPTVPSAARAVSDEQGNFQFSGLLPGNYRVIARRSGFVVPESGTVPLAVELIPVRAGEQARKVVLKLNPASAITGKIVDADGAPVQDATVTVLRTAYAAPGRRFYSQISSAGRTDDRGIYSVVSVLPGTYSLRVDPPALLTQLRDPAGLSYATAYYPEGSDPAGMKTFEVSVGTTKSVDVKLKRVRVFSVSGRVLDANGMGANSATAQLLRDDGSRLTMVGTGTYPRGGGSFEITDVPAGSYVLTASSTVDSARSFGRQRIDVAADVENVRVQPASTGPIQGAVQVEGAAAGSLKGTEIELCRVDSGGVVSPARLKDDLTFSFPNTTASQYTVCVAHLPAPYYVKSVLWGGKEVPASGLDSASAAPLSIAVSAEGAARVEGSVQDSAGKPAPYALVTLFPLDGSALSALTGQAGADGDFVFEAVRPGSYKMLAWESSGSALVMQSAGLEALKPLDGKSATVTLGPGAREKTRLTWVSAEEKQRAFSVR